MSSKLGCSLSSRALHLRCSRLELSKAAANCPGWRIFPSLSRHYFPATRWGLLSGQRNLPRNDFYSKCTWIFQSIENDTSRSPFLPECQLEWPRLVWWFHLSLSRFGCRTESLPGSILEMMDCVKKVNAEEGFLTFAKGLEPTLWRHAMWNGGYFGVIHFVRSIIPKPGTNRDMQEEQLKQNFKSPRWKNKKFLTNI